MTKDDLISRQAAIDALKGMAVPLYKDPACEDIWERDRTLDNAIDAIRGLPSAQPEIIRCKDCKYYRDGDCWHERENDRWIYYQSVINEPNPDDYCSRAERKEE